MTCGRALLVALAGVLTLGGCSPDRPARADGVESVVVSPPRPTTGPYVSVAVDNHFHDVHPEDNIEIAGDRAFIVRNEGSNPHNVTISGTDIDVDLNPGEQVKFYPVQRRMPPGPYTLTCRFHGALGMVGEFRVVAP